jgi:serine phosphatase RsbU (regulator of sigma subunit)
MHGRGTITLVIGDVVGHGLAAAAVMGKLSSAARALATAVADPAALVRELERFAAGTPGGEMTTVVCADFTQATRVLRYCRAGHPPPIVRMPDGRVVLLDAPGGGPLCSGAGPRHHDEIELPPGAILVAYTDGLIDWHESTLEQRMAELVEVASGLDAGDPERMSSTSPQTDDIAVLCLAVAHG